MIMNSEGRATTSTPPRISVVQNWFEDLKSKVPPNQRFLDGSEPYRRCALAFAALVATSSIPLVGHQTRPILV
jgi:hypothetical protein